MDALTATPEFLTAMIAVIVAGAGLITAVAFYVRTVGEIAKINAAGAEKEREHKLNMEALEKSVELEREKQTNITEAKMFTFVETQVDIWRQKAEAQEFENAELRRRMDDLERHLGESDEKRRKVASELANERRLREQLEADFDALKQSFEVLKTEKQAIEVERDRLRVENTDLKQRLDKLSNELADTQQALTMLERKFQEYEARHNGGDDDPPTPPGSQQPPPGNVRPLNADGAASDATVSGDDGGSNLKRTGTEG